MTTFTQHTEIDSHERRATYYIDDNCVATLDLQSDKFETFEPMTQHEKDEAYTSMRIEANEFMNEFNLM